MLAIFITSAFVVILTLSLLSLSSSQDNSIAVFAYHGEEIFLTIYNSSFIPLTTAEGNQISVFVNYELRDSSIANQRINGVMKVYAPNGTLIRTSSYPSGFIAQSSSGGKAGLETTIVDPTIQSVTANISFTNAQKTETISNDVKVKLNLNATTTTAEAGVGEEESAEPAEPEESLLEESPQEVPSQPPSEEEGGGEEEATPSVPFFQ